ncbi:hypothetical protein AMIS_79510 [Actinoplanes missouriensis 431]|uniref:Uncharacterized protein n=1 Tax=Actinoplanes missouriensis (strain ATCC 14538 / DSM 43046 / CBS 188.64 / JCM 3121 / NBRC 102363 / NCIMB 12654 / NRRL B-3342 / UNCC 431) TaxID=512565 RepID=I0HJI4_ACTM4|nr:hypothetical protein [Actinoplanes missouriensis]BAL93171.1 hypothetical protein AMIS_79510 [Actinoplanes missouriensis 431]
MSTQAKPRFSPTAIWGITSVGVLVTALVLWAGWPAQAAELTPGTAEVYLIDDELTTPAPTGEKSGWFGTLSTPCDFDSWYVESAGTAMCATLDGPKGTVTLGGAGKSIAVATEGQQAITGWVAEAGSGGAKAPTRALLVRDGDPIGVVAVAEPGTVVPVG